MIILKSPTAGLLSMVPNVFPIVVIFGLMGWIGVLVDIGIMMTASVAMGVAVDDTVHFLTWFRRGILSGLDRRGAVRLAYERCATAMIETTLIGGLGLGGLCTEYLYAHPAVRLFDDVFVNRCLGRGFDLSTCVVDRALGTTFYRSFGAPGSTKQSDPGSRS